MQWHFEERDGTGVLHLSGFLGDHVTHRFEGAVGWACSRCAGAIVVDMSALVGWSREGEAAIMDAAGLLAAHRAPLAVCGLGDRHAPLLLAGDALALVRVYPDLDSALAAVAAR
ncbi:STAS domain-containing protein [Kitasatospora azatica]|uniref:STAS domain-containing protein n=1 Tax=Kitasatospora azatica TaxID=58347 RepID=UPI00056ACAD4|nr:STAS domain-containing protein [Kitasatospora azatica]